MIKKLLDAFLMKKQLQALEQLLRDAMRRKAVNELFDAADKLADANLPTMTMEEIQEEVNNVRKQRQHRAPGT
ncbi:MAG: hypothetical protein P8077_04945 [Gammaproteobacteria bacterium]